MRVKILASVGAAGLLLATSAMADTVTVTFAGVLNNPTSGSETGAYSGTATYQSTSGQPFSADQGLVVDSFSITSPVFNDLYGFSTVTKTTFPYAYGDVIDNPDGTAGGLDRFEMVFYLGAQKFSRLTLDVIYPANTLPSGYQLPTSLPPISQASILSSRFDDGYFDTSFGNITTFTLTSEGSAAPEPAAWALAILGFATTGAALRRRRALAAV